MFFRIKLVGYPPPFHFYFPPLNLIYPTSFYTMERVMIFKSMGMRVNKSKNTEGEEKTYKGNFLQMGFDCQSEDSYMVMGISPKSIVKKEEKKMYKESFGQLRLGCQIDYSSTIGRRVDKVLGFNKII